MALSDIALSSRALMRIGAAPITSFNDGSAESELAGALFRPVCDAMLSSYAWSFATGQIELNRLLSSPVADYSYSYQLPNDFLRALSAGQGAENSAGAKGRGLNFRISGNVLHTNESAVVLTYIFRPDEESFPPYFDQALITRLAAEFCIPVTENTSRAEGLFRLAEKDFQRARQIDAQQDTPSRIEDFTLIKVRD